MEYANLCLGCIEEKEAVITCSCCGYEESSVSELFLQLPPGTTLQDKYLLGRVLD